ncbi:MAG: hypothetical protein ACREGC_02985, partial [Minisyncoccia bacterium]
MSATNELWRPNSPDFVYPDSVLETKETMNSLSYDEVMGDIPIMFEGRHAQNGINSALIGTPGSSTEEAVVLYLAFANKLSSHNLIKADFIRRVLDRAGIRDDGGKPLPVLEIASPSLGSTIRPLGKNGGAEITAGVFYPATKPSLDIVKHRGFGKVGLIGHSQGGTFAIHAAGQAYDAGLDLKVAAPSDMLGTKEFQKTALLKAFGSDADYLEHEVVSAGLKAYVEAFGYDRSSSWLKRRAQDARFLIDVAAHPKLNLFNLFPGLGKLTFEDALARVVDSEPDEPIVVGYGNKDQLVADRGTIQLQMNPIWRGGTSRVNYNGSLVEIEDGRHT